MTDENLRRLYTARYNDVLRPLESKLQDHLRGIVADFPRIDQVTARAKSIDSFMGKANRREGGVPKYTDPLKEIQDQIGARIVTYYPRDVPTVQKLIEGSMGSIETLKKAPDSVNEFGYEGVHYILFVPEDIIDDRRVKSSPKFFELQIKTLFQHAWGQAEHDFYKPDRPLTLDQRRRIAFTAAQAWGADRIFDELAGEQHNSTPTTN